MHLLDAYIQYYGMKDGASYFSSKRILSVTFEGEYLDFDAYSYPVLEECVSEYIDHESNRTNHLIPALGSYYTGKNEFSDGVTRWTGLSFYGMGIDVSSLCQKRSVTLNLPKECGIRSRTISRPPAVFFQKEVNVSTERYDYIHDELVEEYGDPEIDAFPINDCEDYKCSCSRADFIAIAPEHHLDWILTLAKILEFKLLVVTPEIEIPKFEQGIFTFPSGGRIYIEEKEGFPQISVDSIHVFEEYQRQTVKLWGQAKYYPLRDGQDPSEIQRSQEKKKNNPQFPIVNHKEDDSHQGIKSVGVNLLSYTQGHIIVFGYCPAAELARVYGCQLTGAIKQRLARFRNSNLDGWIQRADGGKGNEKYLYRVDAVADIFTDL